MGNEWIDFVRQFAKDNDITYSRAIKEAGPAYRKLKKKGKSTVRGKGLDDLPDTSQANIGSYLDDQSLLALSRTNKAIHEGVKSELNSIYAHVMRDADQLLGEFGPFGHPNMNDQVIERMRSNLEDLRRIKNHPLLTNQQRDLVQFPINKLSFYISLYTPEPTFVPTFTYDDD